MKLVLLRLTWLEEFVWTRHRFGWGFWGNTPVEYRGKLWWRAR